MPSIKHTDYQSERLQPFKPETPPSKGGHKYWSIKILYKYAITDKNTGKVSDQIAPLEVNAPELETEVGINYRLNKKETDKEGKESKGINITREQYVEFEKRNACLKDGEAKFNVRATLPVRFDLSDQNQRLLIGDTVYVDSDGNTIESEDETVVGFYQKLFTDIQKLLYRVRGDIGCASIKKPEEFAIKFNDGGPIHYKTDPATNQPIKGGKPSRFYTLMARGKYGTTSRIETLFSIPIKSEGGKKFENLDWANLSNVKMRFKPIISSFQITILGNGVLYFKDEIKEAIVTKIARSGFESSQTEELEEMANDTEHVNTLAAEIEAIRNLKSTTVENSNTTTELSLIGDVTTIQTTSLQPEEKKSIFDSIKNTKAKEEELKGIRNDINEKIETEQINSGKKKSTADTSQSDDEAEEARQLLQKQKKKEKERKARESINNEE